MATSEPVRMTTAQHTALDSANAEGLPGWTDRRVIKALIRRGWRANTLAGAAGGPWYITAASFGHQIRGYSD